MNICSRTSILRAIGALTLGVLLLVRAQEIPLWLITASGVLFAVWGIISVVTTLVRKSTTRHTQFHLVVAVGCILFGLTQIAMPERFFAVLDYALGGLLLLGFCVQAFAYYALYQQKTSLRGALGITLLAGFLLIGTIAIGIAYQHTALHSPLLMSMGFLLYGVPEAIYYFALRRKKKTDLPTTTTSDVVEVRQQETENGKGLD